MNTDRPAADLSPRSFPVVRRGYERAEVDRFAQTVQEDRASLRRQCEALAAENSQLRETLGDARSRPDPVEGLRRESLADSERVRVEAANEAGRVLTRAQQQANTIEERSRQEFAWRRRQLRHEQELLTRHKRAMLALLTSLSALAAETTESPPEVPKLALDDVDGPQTSEAPWTADGGADRELVQRDPAYS